MKIKIILILLVTSAIAAVIILFKTGVIGNNRVSIVEETPNIVEAVEQIQELCTEYYYDEVTAQKQVEKKGVSAAAANAVNSTTQWFTNLFSKKSDTIAQQQTQTVSKLEKELVVIAKVTCRVGYDLKEIMANDGMQVNGDTLFIDLPSPKFLETIVNPTDLDIFAESGSWTFPDDLKTVVDWAKETVENRAINDSIFEKADKSGRKILSNLFSTMGFNVIYNTPKKENSTIQTP
jgi:hypothetical protein